VIQQITNTSIDDFTGFAGVGEIIAITPNPPILQIIPKRIREPGIGVPTPSIKLHHFDWFVNIDKHMSGNPSEQFQCRQMRDHRVRLGSEPILMFINSHS
jgi:hypothetical protein